MHRTIRIIDQNKQTVVIAKTHHFLQLHANIDVYLGSKEKPQPDIIVKGSIFSKDFKFFNQQEEMIAHVNRKILTVRNILTGNDTYHVEVVAGQDRALIVSLVVCIEEMFETKDRS